MELNKGMRLSNLKKKIMVSNSGKQYAHRLIYALQLHNYFFNFYTSFWYKPGKFPFILINVFPKAIRKKIVKEFEKRSFDKVDQSNVFQFAWFEIIREIIEKIMGNKYSEKILYYRDRLHDWYVTRKVTIRDYDIIIGYEECSVNLFKTSKKKGLTTVLDLAQIHYKDIEKIAKQFPVFGEVHRDVTLRKKINRIKEKEITNADYIICLSEFAKTSLIENGLSPNNVFVVNLGFDPEKFKPKKIYTSSQKLKVIYVGTVTARKGIDILLEANREMLDFMELTIVGPMADAKILLDNYKGQYQWYDYMDHDSLYEIMNKSDLFVFPSYLDSWAMVVIEAMACGLPVIVSDNTGAQDAVAKGGGFIIPTGSKESLKEKITFFYNHRDQLEKKGREARDVVMQYTWENYYYQVNSIMEKICAK